LQVKKRSKQIKKNEREEMKGYKKVKNQARKKTRL
jgi:hypothetical protein